MGEHDRVSEVRLNQARKRIDEFKSELKSYLDSEPFKVVKRIEQTEESATAIFTLRLFEEPPDALGLTYGEAIAQLRATCDNLIVALGAVHLGNHKHKRSLAFPATLDRSPGPIGGNKDFESWANRFPFPEPVLHHLRLISPFSECQSPDGRVWTGVTHPLYVLAELSNQDKHRVPLVVSAHHAGSTLAGLPIFMGLQPVVVGSPGVSAFASFSVRSRIAGAKEDEWIDHQVGTLSMGGKLSDCAEIARMSVPIGTCLDAVSAPISLEVVLGESAAAGAGQNCEQLIERLFGFVEHAVVKGMSRFFK